MTKGQAERAVDNALRSYNQATARLIRARDKLERETKARQAALERLGDAKAALAAIINRENKT